VVLIIQINYSKDKTRIKEALVVQYQLNLIPTNTNKILVENNKAHQILQINKLIIVEKIKPLHHLLIKNKQEVKASKAYQIKVHSKLLMEAAPLV
jgi:hypothetical protein